MSYTMEEKELFNGQKVKVLGATFEPGKPSEPLRWRHKDQTRQELLKFLESSQRYWYSDEWYGSERRKNPA